MKLVDTIEFPEMDPRILPEYLKKALSKGITDGI